MPTWKAGDMVSIWGPLGNGFPPPEADHLMLVAGGIGQTPFLAVAREALGLRSYGSPPRAVSRRPRRVTLCYGVRSAEYLAGLEEFALPGLEVRLPPTTARTAITDLSPTSFKRRLPVTIGRIAFIAADRSR